MLSAVEYLAYLERFASVNMLQKFITFNVEVNEVQKLPSGKFSVSVSGEHIIYDAVCITTGLHSSSPSFPDFLRSAKIDVVHSSQIHDFAEKAAGKNVLIIGLGESGSDISLITVKVAKSVTISVRDNGSGYVVPRITGNEVSDLNTNRGRGRGETWGPSEHKRFAESVIAAQASDDDVALSKLSKIWTGKEQFSELEIDTIVWNYKNNALPYNRFGTKNTSFLEALKLGARIIGEIVTLGDLPSGTDLVICCTGFAASKGELVVGADINHRNRWRHVVDLNLGPMISFVGFSRPAFGAVPPISEMGGRWWAAFLRGDLEFDVAAAAIETQEDKKYEESLFKKDFHRLKSLVQYHRMMKAFGDLLGVSPPLGELRKHHKGIYERVMRSTLSGAQFRLVGRFMSEKAWKTCEQLPLPQHERMPRSAFNGVMNECCQF